MSAAPGSWSRPLAITTLQYTKSDGVTLTFKKIAIAADGNCFYSAIARDRHGQEVLKTNGLITDIDKINWLRVQSAEQVRRNSLTSATEIFGNAYAESGIGHVTMQGTIEHQIKKHNRSVDLYCKNMKWNATFTPVPEESWADDFILAFMPDVINYPIHVFEKSESDQKSLKLTSVWNGIRDKQKNKEPVCLLYTGENHYTLLERVITTDEAMREEAEAEAAEAAKAAQAEAEAASQIMHNLKKIYGILCGEIPASFMQELIQKFMPISQKSDLSSDLSKPYEDIAADIIHKWGKLLTDETILLQDKLVSAVANEKSPKNAPEIIRRVTQYDYMKTQHYPETSENDRGLNFSDTCAMHIRRFNINWIYLQINGANTQIEVEQKAKNETLAIHTKANKSDKFRKSQLDKHTLRQSNAKRGQIGNETQNTNTKKAGWWNPCEAWKTNKDNYEADPRDTSAEAVIANDTLARALGKALHDFAEGPSASADHSKKTGKVIYAAILQCFTTIWRRGSLNGLSERMSIHASTHASCFDPVAWNKVVSHAWNNWHLCKSQFITVLRALKNKGIIFETINSPPPVDGKIYFSTKYHSERDTFDHNVANPADMTRMAFWFNGELLSNSWWILMVKLFKKNEIRHMQAWVAAVRQLMLPGIRHQSRKVPVRYKKTPRIPKTAQFEYLRKRTMLEDTLNELKAQKQMNIFNEGQRELTARAQFEASNETTKAALTRAGQYPDANALKHQTDKFEARLADEKRAYESGQEKLENQIVATEKQLDRLEPEDFDPLQEKSSQSDDDGTQEKSDDDGTQEKKVSEQASSNSVHVKDNWDDDDPDDGTQENKVSEQASSKSDDDDDKYKSDNDDDDNDDDYYESDYYESDDDESDDDDDPDDAQKMFFDGVFQWEAVLHFVQDVNLTASELQQKRLQNRSNNMRCFVLPSECLRIKEPTDGLNTFCETFGYQTYQEFKEKKLTDQQKERFLSYHNACKQYTLRMNVAFFALVRTYQHHFVNWNIIDTRLPEEIRDIQDKRDRDIKADIYIKKQYENKFGIHRDFQNKTVTIQASTFAIPDLIQHKVYLGDRSSPPAVIIANENVEDKDLFVSTESMKNIYLQYVTCLHL